MTMERHIARTRIRDERLGQHNVRVQPGEYYVTRDRDVMIITVLGSCVAACIRNPFNGFGGMNHFMLPQSEAGDWNGVSAHMRYGNHAMENLINEVLKSGCRRSEMEIKLFGGANMYVGSSEVGAKNVGFVTRYLKDEGLFVAARDLGGDQGRRIHYWPSTGKVKRLLLTGGEDSRIVTAETTYRSRLSTAPVEGDIELFG